MSASIYLLAGIEEAFAGLYGGSNYESFTMIVLKDALEKISYSLCLNEKPFTKDEVISITNKENYEPNPLHSVIRIPDTIYVLKREAQYLMIGYENKQISHISLYPKYFLELFK